MSIPRNMNPAEPQFDLFSSPFYLIAHVDFKYHEDLDRVMQKYDVDRTTYRLLSVLLAVGLENIKVICEHALVKRSTGSRAIERRRLSLDHRRADRRGQEDCRHAAAVDQQATGACGRWVIGRGAEAACIHPASHDRESRAAADRVTVYRSHRCERAFAYCI
jgi:hypothetical protein